MRSLICRGHDQRIVNNLLYTEKMPALPEPQPTANNLVKRLYVPTYSLLDRCTYILAQT